MEQLLEEREALAARMQYVRSELLRKSGDSPTISAQSYLGSVLKKVEDLANEEQNLEYAKHCNSLLAQEPNNCRNLGKMLHDIVNDSETQSETKEDALKMFSELCLVLENAADNSEDAEEKKLASQYKELFQKAEKSKNEMEFARAKKLGFEGTLEEYISSIN